MIVTHCEFESFLGWNQKKVRYSGTWAVDTNWFHWFHPMPSHFFNFFPPDSQNSEYYTLLEQSLWSCPLCERKVAILPFSLFSTMNA